MPFTSSSSASENRISLLHTVAAFALIFGAAVCAYVMQLPPSPKPASVPISEFSAERALKHLRAVASETHPAGSFADDRLIEYCMGQYREMGVQAEVQTAVNLSGVGVYHNVVARIPGTANTKAFAMATHHDSVPYGPGAVDDCGGLGVMLELARAVKEGPPLKNDIIFCFTDAEEFSGGGAHAFTEHPWVKNGDVGIILNFEARGTSGPSYMFETSNENGWLIAEMAKAGVNPRATSVMYDVFKKSPFGSDFGKFKRSGMKGYNIAFVGSFCNYHTRDDHPDVISLASLQHHGEYAYGFTRHFGNMDFTSVTATAPDATYFNPVGGLFVHYPQSWGKPLAALATLLFAALIVFGLVRGHLGVGGLLGGLACFAVCMVCVIALTGALTAFIFQMHGRYVLYNNGLYGTAAALFAIGLTAGLYTVFRRVVRVENLAAAAALGWLALLWGCEKYVPGGAYLGLWPLFFGMAGVAVLFAAPHDGETPPWLMLLAAAFGLPGIFIVVPGLVALISMATILSGAVMAGAIVLLAGFLLPGLALLDRPNRYWLPVGACAAGLLLAGYGVLNNGPSATKPHFNCLTYGMDLDTGKAYWISNDQKPDEWLSQFIPAGTPRARIAEFLPGEYDTYPKPGPRTLGERFQDWLVPPYSDKYLKAPAPMGPMPGPQVTVKRNEVVDGKRMLTLHIGSSEAVTQMRLKLVSPTELLACTLYGKEVNGGKQGWEKNIDLFPREGVDAEFVLNANDPFRLNMVEKIYGLPYAELKMPPRPAHLITEPNTTLDFRRPLRSEHTFINKTFDLSVQPGG